MAIQNQHQKVQHQNDNEMIIETPVACTGLVSTKTMTTSAKATTATATTAAPTVTNNGPRVSFNRDVHVKRIGKRPKENPNFLIDTANVQPQSTHHFRRELPDNLTEEGIRKEAALVIAQVEGLSCKAEGADNIPLPKKKRDSAPNKFHSLPSRKKKGLSKPVTRSSSDASAKKFKRPSIFNIFSRKTEPNNNQIEKESHTLSNGGKRLVRSKSDVGSYNNKDQRIAKQHKKSKDDNNTILLNSTAKQLPSQLSPIIENSQKEDYFEEQFKRERRKSDTITEKEKFAKDFTEFFKRKSPLRTSGNIGYTNHNDLDFIPSKPISENIRETIATLQQAKQQQSKSADDMHSSQLPTERPPLTKGLTVNGMVKRLSMERFSPPPSITSPAFSYIRPNEGIIYAQLASEDNVNGRSHQMHQLKSQPVRSNIINLDATLGDQTPTYSTSHNNVNVRTSYSSNGENRVTIQSPIQDERDSFSPVTGPTLIRIGQSTSPSPWKQLSPRNLSDEDEGLGIEIRKYYDEDQPIHKNKYSNESSPLYDNHHAKTMLHYGDDQTDSNNTYLYKSKEQDPISDLGQRRAMLESRILTRRFNLSDKNERDASYPTAYRSPNIFRNIEDPIHETSTPHYLSTELGEQNRRFHKLQSAEIMNRYSPERSHLDMIAPSMKLKSISVPLREQKTSRYIRTKYYDDGTGGVKEVYERETRLDENDQPYVHESRRREQLDSSTGARKQSSPIEKHQTLDYEPKSLDSLYTTTEMYRSSPENQVKRREGSMTQNTIISDDTNWQSSLKRDKRQQRSFDKGDSGIENDFRKESFNGDISNRWRKRTPLDDMKACELFIKKEQRHSEQQHPGRKKLEYIYRERSIDDGSHFDPRLDKYPTSTSTLRRINTSTQVDIDSSKDTSSKPNKKLGGFEKVKQLFSGSGSGRKKENDAINKANCVRNDSPQSSKDKYMVKEEEMRSRYHEYRGTHQNNLRNAKAADISMRRRLSTPKASPLLLKRTSSEKTHKKSSMFPKNSSPEIKSEKSSWFKSLDRKSKSKSKEKEATINEEDEVNSKHKTYPMQSSPFVPSKNLRFFGDTDLESNSPTISKVSSATRRSRTPVSILNCSQKKYSQSACHLDQINNEDPSVSAYLPPLSEHTMASSRNRSSSLHNLDNNGVDLDETDFRKRRHYSRSRNLDDISESGSESEDKPKRLTNTTTTRSLSRERLDRLHRYDDHAYRKSSDRYSLERTPVEYRHSPHHLLGPPKPARSADRRILSSRVRDRLPADSSGTEGESSLHSQRSVVYLHATTIGAIPQPYHLSSGRHRSMSRDDVRGKNKQSLPMQPMTRSVSRSVSMLAPWKPKFVSEGYEINYSQEQNDRAKKSSSTLPRKHHLSGSTSSINRNAKKSLGESGTSSRSRRHQQVKKDDQISMRNSSSTSASKSNYQNGDIMESSSRRKVK